MLLYSNTKFLKDFVYHRVEAAVECAAYIADVHPSGTNTDSKTTPPQPSYEGCEAHDAVDRFDAFEDPPLGACELLERGTSSCRPTRSFGAMISEQGYQGLVGIFLYFPSSRPMLP